MEVGIYLWGHIYAYLSLSSESVAQRGPSTETRLLPKAPGLALRTGILSSRLPDHCNSLWLAITVISDCKPAPVFTSSSEEYEQSCVEKKKEKERKKKTRSEFARVSYRVKVVIKSSQSAYFGKNFLFFKYIFKFVSVSACFRQD